VGFGWFECFLLFVVVGARNERISTLLTLILTFTGLPEPLISSCIDRREATSEKALSSSRFSFLFS
jgi:hypothetical protein